MMNDRASSLIRGGPPLCSASVLYLLLFRQLEDLPLTTRRVNRTDYPRWLGGHPEASHLRQSDRFPCSTPEPKPCSRHLYAGHRLGSKQVAPRLFPRHRTNLGFDVVDGFSTRHQWFTCVRVRCAEVTAARPSRSWPTTPQRRTVCRPPESAIESDPDKRLVAPGAGRQ
jgi:hypothetical protein